MNIKLSEKTGELYDLFASIYVACNFDHYIKEVEKINISIDNKFKSVVNEVIKLIGDDIFLYKKYFNKLNFASTLIDTDEIWSINSLNEYINYIRTKDDLKIQKEIIALIDCYNEDTIYVKDEEDYERLINHKDLLIDFLSQKDIGNEDKWTAIEIINNIEKFKENIIFIVNNYQERYFHFIKKYKSDIKTHVNYLNEKYIKSDIEENWPIIQLIKKDTTENIWIIPSYFHAYTHIVSTKKGSNSTFIVIGLYVSKVFDALNRKDSAKKYISIFKNLGDENRYKFIKLISQGEKYGQEIAEELNITSATVNYHANTLLVSNLLKMERHENKTYYSLNKDTLLEMIEFIKMDLEL